MIQDLPHDVLFIVYELLTPSDFNACKALASCCRPLRDPLSPLLFQACKFQFRPDILALDTVVPLIAGYIRTIRVIFSPSLISDRSVSNFVEEYQSSLHVLEQTLRQAESLSGIVLEKFDNALHPALAKVIFSSKTLTRLIFSEVEWAFYPQFEDIVASDAPLLSIECQRPHIIWWGGSRVTHKIGYGLRTDRAVFFEMHGLGQLIRLHKDTLQSLDLPTESFPLVHFGGIPELTHLCRLRLYGFQAHEPIDIPQLLQVCPYVSVLDLEALQLESDFPFLWVPKSPKVHLIQNSNVKTLILNNCDPEEPLLRKLPLQLTTLFVAYTNIFHQRGYPSALKNPRNLRLAAREWSLVLSSPANSSALCHLQHLRIDSSEELDTQMLKCLQNCERLERLDINISPRVPLSDSLALLEQSLQSFTTLRYLCLVNGPIHTELKPDKSARMQHRLQALEDRMSSLSSRCGILRIGIPSLWRVSFEEDQSRLSFHLCAESREYGSLESIYPDVPSSVQELFPDEYIYFELTRTMHERPDISPLAEPTKPRAFRHLVLPGEGQIDRKPFTSIPRSSYDYHLYSSFDWETEYRKWEMGEYLEQQPWKYAQPNAESYPYGWFQ